MSNNELNLIIKENLIKYISIISNDLNIDELHDYDMYSLVGLYCETYSVPIDSFYACLADLVKEYKNTNPDESLSDEEIYIVTDAFAPVNHFGEAESYFEQTKIELTQQIEKANSASFECLEEVRLEKERLENCKTSLIKSEIRSDLVYAQRALDKARSDESKLKSKEKNLCDYYNRFVEKRNLYYSKINSNREDNATFKLSRTNTGEAE